MVGHVCDIVFVDSATFTIYIVNIDAAFTMSVIDKINQSGLRFSKTHPAIKAKDFPAVTQVSVSNIDDKWCKKDMLKAYFSNRKISSGGPVHKVEVVGKGRTIISFESSSSLG